MILPLFVARLLLVLSSMEQPRMTLQFEYVCNVRILLRIFELATHKNSGE